jgi:hypothetical protein
MRSLIRKLAYWMLRHAGEGPSALPVRKPLTPSQTYNLEGTLMEALRYEQDVRRRREEAIKRLKESTPREGADS